MVDLPPVEFDADCERIALTMARRLRRDGYGLPDGDAAMVQEARVAVWSSIAGYRVTAGVPWELFARICVRRRLMGAVRAEMTGKVRFARSMSRLDEPIGGTDELPFHEAVPSPLPSPEEAAEQREAARRVLAAVAHPSLSALERRVIIEVVLCGAPYKAVGDPKAVDNARTRGLAKVRELAA